MQKAFSFATLLGFHPPEEPGAPMRLFARFRIIRPDGKISLESHDGIPTVIEGAEVGINFFTSGGMAIGGGGGSGRIGRLTFGANPFPKIPPNIFE